MSETAPLTTTAVGHEQTPVEQPEAPAPRSRPRWVIPVGALAVGLLIGGGIGAGIVAASSDPTRSAEYQALQHKSERKIAAAEKRASDAGDRVRVATNEMAARSAELDTREQAVAAREAAVTATEQQIAANSISEGTWTVGRDVAAGTYRTKDAISGDCYWSITRSGTNGSDIVENDIPTGGFPTVTLQPGQDFTNRDCGTFVKQ